MRASRSAFLTEAAASSAAFAARSEWSSAYIGEGNGCEDVEVWDDGIVIGMGACMA